jgi:hypothetical protein
MSEPEIKDAETIEDAPPERPALPPPSSHRAEVVPSAGVVDRLLLLGEQQPLVVAVVVFALLTLLHLVVLNAAGIATGLYIGDTFFTSESANPVEIVLLAFVAYNMVLPTLVSQTCIGAYDDLRSAFAFDDRAFGQTRASLLDPFFGVRLGAGLLWAVLLTPVFGSLLRNAIVGEGTPAALLTIWMYVRIALTFGLLGANIGFVIMLHHRFRVVTGTHLRVDLFDMTPLQPVARHARDVALLLFVLLALAGPAVAQPEAMYSSAILLAVGVILVGIAVVGSMWGAHRAIRAAKKVAVTDLQAYSRELWRRAYVNNRVAEAVAIPALGAMITVRNEITRLADWPGGWGVVVRIATLVIIPVITWFGAQLSSQVVDMFAG